MSHNPRIGKETAIEKKTPDHDCESIGGKMEEVVSYFRNSSVLNGSCSRWQRKIWNFWWLSTSHHHIQEHKLLRAVRRNRQQNVCFKTPAPVDHQFEVPDQFAYFILQTSWNDENEGSPILGDEKWKKYRFFCNSCLIFGKNEFSPKFFQILTSHNELHGSGAAMFACITVK